MESSRRFLRLVSCGLAVLLVFFCTGLAVAQSPNGTPHAMRGAGLDLAPSNPVGMPGTTGGLPGGSDTLSLSSRMFPDILPTIPGLEFSYLHSFNKYKRWSRLLVEYVRPVRLSPSTTLYGEIHGTLYNPGRSWSSWTDAIDLSAGGGYRRRFGDRSILGFHGFYDATRRRDQWYSSASAGGFMLAMLPGDDAIDLTVNWYGGANTGPFGVGSGGWGQGTFDGTVTYNHELWQGGPDLQLSLIGYAVGDQLRPVFYRETGYGARVRVASRDGMFRGFYMYENDSYFDEIHTVGVNLNVGFRLENLLALDSPIEKPTPIYASPRNLDYFQNVATGTERHLAKLRSDHGNCDYYKVGDCWNAIVGAWWPEFKSANNNGEPWNTPHWVSYVLEKVQNDDRCTEVAANNCLYFAYKTWDSWFECTSGGDWHWNSNPACTVMALKARPDDWGCCPTCCWE